MERQPRKTTLRDVEEGAEVTLLAMVVRNDPKREQTLVRFPRREPGVDRVGRRHASPGRRGPHRVQWTVRRDRICLVASRGLPLNHEPASGPWARSLAARHGSAADGLAEAQRARQRVR